MDIDPQATAGLTIRTVRTGERDGTPTRLVIASRTYSTEQSDLWDALTNPERISRWFLPVSGELKVGARYQLEGSSGGLIEACIEPSSFAVTWEYDGSMSWVRVTLEPTEVGTTLELVHESPVDPPFWKQYGPGATGLGWDMTMLFLSQHLATGEEFDPADENAFWGSPEGAAFRRSAATAWADAAINDGDPVETAREAAERSADFYTPDGSVTD